MAVESETRRGLQGPHFEILLKRLGGDTDTGAREYDVVRRKLTGFFVRRGCRWAEKLADDTIDRVARRLGEGEAVVHLNAYFYGVARLVLLESRRHEAREQEAHREHVPAPMDDGAPAWREKRIACLDRCLATLPHESRDLVVKYHRVQLEGRKQLADLLGITYVSLKTRAHRVRTQLAGCVSECLQASA
jgi:DNA-directed RNA polymerase specialized sigma24 family protein